MKSFMSMAEVTEQPGRHPTAGLHMLRGELLVWLSGLTLLDAMFTTQDLLRSATETAEELLTGD
jgi:hypothetical protein